MAKTLQELVNEEAVLRRIGSWAGEDAGSREGRKKIFRLCYGAMHGVPPDHDFVSMECIPAWQAWEEGGELPGFVTCFYEAPFDDPK